MVAGDGGKGKLVPSDGEKDFMKANPHHIWGLARRAGEIIQCGSQQQEASLLVWFAAKYFGF